jgi:cytochrome subunit of sulfide dehydrogenase
MTRRRAPSLSLPRKRGRVRVGVICALSLAAVAVASVAHAQAPNRLAPPERYGTPIGGVGIPPPGASSCSGCHPASQSVDTPAGRLIGRNPSDIITAVQAFRSGQRPATVMDRISKGFTDDEMKAIADWYGAQKNQ